MATYAVKWARFLWAETTETVSCIYQNMFHTISLSFTCFTPLRGEKRKIEKVNKSRVFTEIDWLSPPQRCELVVTGHNVVICMRLF